MSQWAVTNTLHDESYSRLNHNHSSSFDAPQVLRYVHSRPKMSYPDVLEQISETIEGLEARL